MGSSSSKVAKGAARKYPTRAPGSAVPQSRPRREPGAATAAASASASATRASKASRGEAMPEDVRADGMDPDFAPGGFSQRLHQMGIAQPAPTYSPSSTATPFAGSRRPAATPTGPLYASPSRNPTLTALEARKRLQQEAEDEFASLGRAGHAGKRFLDVRALADAVKLRDAGVSDGEVEQRLRIRAGLLGRLGPAGVVVTHVTSTPG